MKKILLLLLPVLTIVGCNNANETQKQEAPHTSQLILEAYTGLQDVSYCKLLLDTNDMDECVKGNEDAKKYAPINLMYIGKWNVSNHYYYKFMWESWYGTYIKKTIKITEVPLGDRNAYAIILLEEW